MFKTHLRHLAHITTTHRLRVISDWFFQCMCMRCCDATEFGTRSSQIKCPNCKQAGFVTPYPTTDKAMEIFTSLMQMSGVLAVACIKPPYA